MDTSTLKSYAPKARRDFIAAVTRRAALFGLTADGASPVREEGQLVFIEGQAHPKAVGNQRQNLAARIEQQGFQQVMEAAAYTWFNRFAAIRFMELHGYLDHSFRVLSHPAGNGLPEILEHAHQLDLPGLDKERVVEFKMDGTRDEDLYRDILLAQCHALHKAMPFLFERVDDATELLLPDNLLQTDSLIRELVIAIPEEDWREIEIIGWLYQFYISEKKGQVIGKVVKSEDIPAATQLFTPNWIVKYMVHNSLGAQWMATYPVSPLKGQMEYYIEPAEQTEEVKAQLAAITPSSLNPEDLTLIDPACGSGHILVEAYELFKAIYLERGYRQRDVAKLILEGNLFGLDIDGRAAQLTGFALMMKGRADDRRLFERGVKLNVMALENSAGFDTERLAQGVRLADYELQTGDLTELRRLFEHATTFGSLIQVPQGLAKKLAGLKQLSGTTSQDLFVSDALERLEPLVQQAELLAAQYDAVVANPPYMGSKGMNALVKKFAKEYFPSAKADLFACFIERGFGLAKDAGHNAMVTMQSWMSLPSFEKMRQHVLEKKTLTAMAHLGARAFGSISGEVVQTTAAVVRNTPSPDYKPAFVRLLDGGEEEKQTKLASGEQRFATIAQNEFKKIPGSPLSYWVPGPIRELFTGMKCADRVIAKQGLATCKNELFLRNWSEVSVGSIGFRLTDGQAAAESGLKWFPYNKGGEYRSWYGNSDFVVNWKDHGRDIHRFSDLPMDYAGAPVRAKKFYFRSSVSWTDLTSKGLSARYYPAGHIFDVSGHSAFCETEEDERFILCFLNTRLAERLGAILNASFHFQVGDFKRLPYPDRVALSDTQQFAIQAVSAARQDWDSFETSWDFQSLPLLKATSDPASTLESSYTAWTTQNRDTIAEMKRLEEENNRLFIGAYSLQDELTSDVPIEQITLTVNPAYRYGKKVDSEQWTVDSGFGEELEARFRQDTMKELISYAIGCMMGRYRLDRPGLIYAHSGNRDFWEIYGGVDSGQWTVDGEQPSGSGGVAESNAVGRKGVSHDESVSEGGAVRAKQSDSTGRGVHSFEHRRGAGTAVDSGVRSVSLSGDGIQGGSRNSNDDRGSTGLRERSPGQGDHGSIGGNFQNAPQPARQINEQGAMNSEQPRHLSTVHYPLSTNSGFQPDDDGIVPLTDTDWFDDDATHRLIEFISVAWDAAHLEDNLSFLADNLSPKKSESSRDTIRRYLCDSFFKDHLQTYKKRPIYWLFSSGKQKGFQCLVYLHRYNEGTLARMRMEYVVPLQSKMAARIDKLADDIQAASTSAQAKRLQKERDKLTKQLDELRRFDEQLRHYADLRIKLDLDDGVKVNYGKFGNLLAEVKAVTGKAPQ